MSFKTPQNAFFQLSGSRAMPSLKDYIQSLFKLSGSQAFPSSQYQTFTTSVNGDWGEQHVATSDGYVCIWGINLTEVIIQNSNQGSRLHVQNDSDSGAIFPIRKGETFQALVAWTGDTAPKYRFYYSVGAS